MSYSDLSMTIFSLVAVLAALGQYAAAAVPPGWTKNGLSPPNTPIFLQIALTSPNEEEFLRRADDMGTPGSPHYRQHLSAKELADWFKPSSASVTRVQSWLQKHGIESSLNVDVLEAHTSAVLVEHLLNCTYYAFEHPSTPGKEIHRVESYDLPEEMEKYVDLITPTTNFPSLKRESKEHLAERSVQNEPSSDLPTATLIAAPLPTSACEYIGTECQRGLYNITYQAKSNSNISFSIYTAGFGIIDSDVPKFLQIYNKPAANANATVDIVNFQGATDKYISPEVCGGVQTSLALAWPLKELLYHDKNEINEWGTYHAPYREYPKQTQQQEDHFFQFLHQLAFNETAPAILTVITSSQEFFQLASVAGPAGPREVIRLCRAFAQLSARGVSTIFASGDFGADVVPTRDDYFNPKLSNDTRLHADVTWPGSCPFVTTVGATKVVNPGTNGKGINETSFAAGGGGVSMLVNRPSWQDGFVDTYIKNSAPSSITDLYLFNPNGRGVPDLAAVGQGVPIVFDGKLSRFQGTCFGAAVVTAIFALLNDYEVSHGRPRLGHINPWLYQQSSKGIVRDIAQGPSNFYPLECHSNKTCLATKPGYVPAKGWDAITGLGAPNFGMMLENLNEMAKLLPKKD